MSFSRGREKQWPRSPADSVPSPGIVGIAEVTMWQLPFLLEWQGDSGSQPTTQVLTGCAGNAKAEQQGFHTLFLVLWAVRVCVHVCVHAHAWGRAWEMGAEEPSIFLKELFRLEWKTVITTWPPVLRSFLISVKTRFSFRRGRAVGTAKEMESETWVWTRTLPWGSWGDLNNHHFLFHKWGW